MVVVSHLFFFFRKYFRGRCDSGETHRPLSGTIYFPTAPFDIDWECRRGMKIQISCPDSSRFYFTHRIPNLNLSSLFFALYNVYNKIRKLSDSGLKSAGTYLGFHSRLICAQIQKRKAGLPWNAIPYIDG